MRNIHEVLRAKEQELEQVQTEIEAIKLTIRLLQEEPGAPAVAGSSLASMPAPAVVMRPAGEGTYTPPWDAAPKQFP